jgi:hypothetical protein
MIGPDELILYYQCYHGRYDDPILKFAQDYPPIDVSTESWRQYLTELSAAVTAFTGKAANPASKIFRWTPRRKVWFATVIKRLCEAYPPDDLVESWLNENDNDLQEWVASRLPFWMLGISVVEAAEKIVIEACRENGEDD